MIFLRNLKTGEIREVEAFSSEHAEIRFERYDDVNGKSRFVWEQTSAADARPEQYAHADEIANRRAYGLEDLSMVTSDGTPTSERAAELLADVDPGHQPVAAPERDPADVAAGPKPRRGGSREKSAASSGE